MALVNRDREKDLNDYEKIADVIISHSEIDKIMSELLAAFIDDDVELSYAINDSAKLSFEQKRILLTEIIKRYKDSNWKKELLFFLKTIQNLEQFRNKIAHGNTLREILRKKTLNEIPYLRNNPIFQKEWPQDIDIDVLYSNYNEVLSTNNPYVKKEYLIKGQTDDLYFLIDRLEQIPPSEIIEEVRNE